MKDLISSIQTNVTVAVAVKVSEYNMQNYWQHNVLPIIPDRVNLVAHWSGSDSEENFKRNPNPRYTKESIIYQYNSLGYRSREIDLSCSKPSIICLGCSFTEGVGVNYSESWPAHIEQAFPDHNVYNFGTRSTSGDYIARALYNIGNLLNTSTVFILWPEMFRYEIYHDDSIGYILPNQKLVKDHNSYHYTPDTLTDSNFYNLRQKNIAIINLLKMLYNYQVIEYNPQELKKMYPPGRDSHPGELWHKTIANIFLEKFNVLPKI
jgi:hypothetical protein